MRLVTSITTTSGRRIAISYTLTALSVADLCLLIGALMYYGIEETLMVPGYKRYYNALQWLQVIAHPLINMANNASVRVVVLPRKNTRLRECFRSLVVRRFRSESSRSMFNT